MNLSEKPDKAFKQRLDALTDPNHLPCYLLALSGGLDSVVLLHLLAQAVPKERLLAVYIDHQLQPQSADWQAFCQQLCQSWSLPFQSKTMTVEPGDGPEAAARTARYQALNQSLAEWKNRLSSDGIAEANGWKASPAFYLLTAHHATDQAETFLQRLGRGAGLTGLGSMKMHAPLVGSSRRFDHLRPLLDQPRAVLEAYASREGLSWVEDPSNQSTAFQRNRVRHEVMPALKAIWPQFERTLYQTTERLQEADELLNQLAESDLAELSFTQFRLDLRPFLQGRDWPSAQQARVKNVIRLWARKTWPIQPNARLLDWCLAQLQNPNPEAHPQWRLSDRPVPQLVRIDQGRIYFLQDPDRAYDQPLSQFDPLAWQLEADGLPSALHAWRQTGEEPRVCTMPTGFLGRRQDRGRIKKWFRQQQIPWWQRRVWPVVYSADTPAEHGVLLGYDPLSNLP
ncbi:tRNA lysidine(34) synthetase TilS [Hydrogenovibrio halophilus]|uniref:tRNA lysidine(34) synthetase TilS n=1 Tax=Hydrogenovibrio halophilus TaxID=373391 RepID=UPI00036C404B|nr:tRNA lysidine(34) synthetase TilS [Hydrogenovibrio halophilus]